MVNKLRLGKVLKVEWTDKNYKGWLLYQHQPCLVIKRSTVPEFYIISLKGKRHKVHEQLIEGIVFRLGDGTTYGIPNGKFHEALEHIDNHVYGLIFWSSIVNVFKSVTDEFTQNEDFIQIPDPTPRNTVDSPQLLSRPSSSNKGVVHELNDVHVRNDKVTLGRPKHPNLSRSRN